MPRGRPYTCPYCSSTDTTKKGVRRTKTLGVRAIRYCRGCKRKFTPKNQGHAMDLEPNEPGEPVV